MRAVRNKLWEQDEVELQRLLSAELIFVLLALAVLLAVLKAEVALTSVEEQARRVVSLSSLLRKAVQPELIPLGMSALAVEADEPEDCA